MHDREEDERTKEVIRLSYDTLEMFIKTIRHHMQPGGRPDIVNDMPELVEHQIQRIRSLTWPDPQARALEAARKDKALQRTLKKASRKTPI